jgi:DNA-binding transcriptional ArsR family regulator
VPEDPGGVVVNEGDADIASVASLLADRTRASMLTALANGLALPSGELARSAGVSAGTASEHLSKLTAVGWLSVEQHGRHRYYRISRPEVLAVVESLANMAPVQPVQSLRGARISKALRLARTCYDHLAGTVGVAVFEGLRDQGGITVTDGDWTVNRNARVFADIGLLTLPTTAGRRPQARACLDWSERRHHLAGALGAVVLRHLTEQGWCERTQGNRSVTVTKAGWAGLDTTLGISREKLLAATS